MVSWDVGVVLHSDDLWVEFATAKNVAQHVEVHTINIHREKVEILLHVVLAEEIDNVFHSDHFFAEIDVYVLVAAIHDKAFPTFLAEAARVSLGAVFGTELHVVLQVTAHDVTDGLNDAVLAILGVHFLLLENVGFHD